MLHPQVKFKVSKAEDERIFREFLRYYHTPSERFFQWMTRPHPKLKKLFWSKHISRERIAELGKKYIRGYYRTHEAEIRRSAQKIEAEWHRKEKWFYRNVAKLFAGQSWPKNTYVGYVTMWGIFPRYLHRGTFQVPYRHRIRNYAVLVTAHEMLHFIFYSYLSYHHPRLTSQRHEMAVWHASEIFNALVQGSKSWRKAFGGAPMTYPEHRSVIQRIKKRWRPAEGIEVFLKSALLPKVKKKD